MPRFPTTSFSQHFLPEICDHFYVIFAVKQEKIVKKNYEMMKYF